MPHPSIAEFQQQSNKILDHLRQEFSRLQTGRANASILEHIVVEAYGQRMELKAVASISVQDARSIMIQPWDKSVLAAVEKALIQADVGCNPVNDGVGVRLNFPAMTEERRTQITKVVHQLSEQSKIKVRQDRHAVLAAIEEIADEDERERAKKEFQKLVDEVNTKIETAAKQKEQEVMTI